MQCSVVFSGMQISEDTFASLVASSSEHQFIKVILIYVYLNLVFCIKVRIVELRL